MGEASQAATIAVFILAAILLLQTLALTVLVARLASKRSALESRIERSTEQVAAVLSQSRELLGKVDAVREKIPEWEKRIGEASRTATAALLDIDRKSDETLELLRGTLRNIEGRADSTLEKLAQTNYRVHKAVIDPARHVSAAIMAIQAGIARLLKREPKSPADSYTDSEIFIG